jgi:hypothetical protein
MNTKVTATQIEELAVEIRQYLLDNQLWLDTTIYFNDNAFSTSERLGKDYGELAYNDPSKLFVIENVNPRDYCNYAGEILTMTFEGESSLYDCFWRVEEIDLKRGSGYSERIHEGLLAIFAKRGLYFDFGDSWNLTAKGD